MAASEALGVCDFNWVDANAQRRPATVPELPKGAPKPGVLGPMIRKCTPKRVREFVFQGSAKFVFAVRRRCLEVDSRIQQITQQSFYVSPILSPVVHRTQDGHHRMSLSMSQRPRSL